MIHLVRSDKVYKNMMNAPKEKREDIYRYEIMKPFEYKWSCINVPLKAKQKGGYDVIMASDMLGFMKPSEIDEKSKNAIELISDDKLWEACGRTIQDSLNKFIEIEFDSQIKEYYFALLLANPDSPYVKMSDGYSGDGGIPGYIFVSLVPNELTLSRIPSAVAHEFNHNIRWQFQKWSMNVTLADMMISEGLAENFAVSMYGVEHLGPWVTKTDMETLEILVKPLVKENLEVKGFDGITSYLYGDEIARLRGFFEVGMPYCGGYACGYYLIKFYLEKTGKSIEEATLTPTNEIMKEVEDFWVE